MYTLLVDNKSNSLINTAELNIVQYSALIDSFQILVPQTYEDKEMKDFKVYLEYRLPSAIEFDRTELNLLKDEEDNPILYKEHLQYILPISDEFTAEQGNIELRLLFVKKE